MISASLRFCKNPKEAVAQNLQSSAHPDWLDMHTVFLFLVGIKTDSILFPFIVCIMNF